MKKRLTTAQAAAHLGVSVQRIGVKVHQGHFPRAKLCECGRSILIPIKDLITDCKLPHRRKAGRPRK